jgi:isopenicillin N synthase-like dioxygenase
VITFQFPFENFALNVKQIPTIDLQALGNNSETRTMLSHACADWGFFYVVDHDVDQELTEAMLQAMKRFFSLPAVNKNAIARTSTNAWGYYDQELTKNVRDWKEIFDVGPRETKGPLAGADPQWPESLPGFKATVESYSQACETVSRRLLSAIAIGLETPPDVLSSAFEPQHSSYLRLNYYPTCSDAAIPESPTIPNQGHLGISHHTDAGALTVLMQSAVAGLQVERQGEWHLIEPLKNAFVINIGDVVQVWSNDRYKAPLHRVVANTDLERFSAAYFFNPAYEADYQPLPSVSGDANPPRYNTINWGEFRAGRAAGDYADYGEEIQISHFSR